MLNITVSATRTVKGATKQQWQALIGRDEREGRGCRGGFGLLRGKGAVREAASLRVISKGGSEEREVGLLGLEITGE